MPLPLPTLADIRAAEARIRPTIPPTPFLQSRTLSQMFGCELWLKFENLNFTASFKERGALNKLLLLTPEEREKGVVAVSAGNHALGARFPRAPRRREGNDRHAGDGARGESHGRARVRGRSDLARQDLRGRRGAPAGPDGGARTRFVPSLRRSRDRRRPRHGRNRDAERGPGARHLGRARWRRRLDRRDRDRREGDEAGDPRARRADGALFGHGRLARRRALDGRRAVPRSPKASR